MFDERRSMSVYRSSFIVHRPSRIVKDHEPCVIE